jgi:hypothetical protein
MPELAATLAERGDLAHLALFRWATSASALAWFALRECKQTWRGPGR